jgi:nucleoside-diphosphate-sugar epimerase
MASLTSRRQATLLARGRCLGPPVADRVVVTGGSGRIGRYVVRDLVGRHDVLNADIADPADASISEFAHCDVLDRNAVASAVEGARTICHLGGLDYDTRASDEAFFRINTVGTWNVLEAAATAGVDRVIVASSTSAYGLFDAHPDWKPRYLPIDEAHPCRAYAGYSLSKIVTEEICDTWARSTPMSVISFRPQHVVGVESLAMYDAFVGDAPDTWLSNYVIVDDVARAFAMAVEESIPKSGTFLIGSDEAPRDEPTLEWAGRAIGHLPEIRNPRRYQDSPNASLFTNEKAASVLGWRPQRTLSDLREQVAAAAP